MKTFIFLLLSIISFNACALTTTITWTAPTTRVDSSTLNPDTDIQYSSLKCGTQSNSYGTTPPMYQLIYSDSNGFVGTATLTISDKNITRVFCAVSVTGQPYETADGMQPGLESTNSPEINFDPHKPTFVVPGAITAPGTPIVTITQ